MRDWWGLENVNKIAEIKIHSLLSSPGPSSILFFHLSFKLYCWSLFWLLFTDTPYSECFLTYSKRHLLTHYSFHSPRGYSVYWNHYCSYGFCCCILSQQVGNIRSILLYCCFINTTTTFGYVFVLDLIFVSCAYNSAKCDFHDLFRMIKNLVIVIYI